MGARVAQLYATERGTSEALLAAANGLVRPSESGVAIKYEGWTVVEKYFPPGRTAVESVLLVDDSSGHALLLSTEEFNTLTKACASTKLRMADGRYGKEPSV